METVSIWNSFLGMGDVASILLGELVMNQLRWDWSVFILIFTLLLFSSGLLLQLFVDECPMETISSDLTICEKIY